MSLFRQSKQKTLPDSPVEYPSGVFVHTEKGYFYISAPGKRLRVLSERVLESWAPARVVYTTEAAVAKYKVTSKIKCRNGSLIWNLADGRMYYIEAGKRRHITSPDALTMLGAKSSDALIVSLDELNLHPEGEPLN